MSSFVASLLSFLLLYKYWAIFLIMFSAAIVLPLPTNSLLLAAGAFAAEGYFSFSLSFLAAVAANVLGDCCDYFLAKKYGRRALHTLRVRTPSYIEHLERYMKRHPGPTIFLTRFIGTVGTLTSLLAGFSDMRFISFISYDILGNVISDGGILYAGYFFGANWQDFANLFSLVGLILLGIVIMLLLGTALWYSKHKRTSLN